MWIDPNSVARGVDSGAFARGLQLYRAQKVLSLDVMAPQPGAPHWLVSGQVQGSLRTPYDVELEVAFLPGEGKQVSWTGRCSCPVGLRCKHAVALMLKAAYLRGNPGDGLPPGAADSRAQPTPGTRAREAAEREQREAQKAQALEQQRLQRVAAQAAQWLLHEALPARRRRADAAAHAEHPGTQSPIYLVHLFQQPGSHPVLRLVLAASGVKANGDWSKPKRVAPSHFLRDAYQPVRVTSLDGDALALLGALPSIAPYHHGTLDEWTLNTIAAAQVLEIASRTGRLFLRLEKDHIGPALSWGPAQPVNWVWTQQDAAAPVGRLWQLQGHLSSASAVLCANKPQLYLDPAAQRCGPVVGGESERQQALLDAPALPESLMRQHESALLRRLGTFVQAPPFLPALRRVGGVPVWRLHLGLLSDTGLTASAPPQALCAQLDFAYEGVEGWWGDEQNPAVFEQDTGERVLVQRDLDNEAQAMARLHGLGLMQWVDGMYVVPPHVDQTVWLHWADRQFAPLREAGFEVQTEAALRDWVRHGGALSVELAPTDGTDDAAPSWFDLSLVLEVHGRRVNLLPWLPNIIAQLRPDETTGQSRWPPHIYLPDAPGSGFLRVDTAALQPWLDGLLELFEDRPQDFGGQALRLSRLDALRTRVALGKGVHWQGVQTLDRIAQQLQGHGELPATATPQGLNATLRPYQQHGLDWLQFLRQHSLAGVLADDMGLGKTLQTLAHILSEKEAGRLDRPALVVAPVSLLGNWRREAERFSPALRCTVLHGAQRHEQASDLAQTDLVIAPYSLLQRDRQRWLAQPWHLVVLDEAQNIKNAATQAAQVVGALNTRHRLCLTGTPIENHLGEIWSLFHFLMPGFLGSQQRFAQRFRTPIEKHGDARRMAQLRARLTPFILRRTKDLVATELPPKVETTMAVELSHKQADLYETIRLSMEKAVREAIEAKGLAKSQIAILDALLKLRQVCCDPRLVKTAAATKVKTSAKLEQLMELLPEMLAEGRRVLLFSQFTSMLRLIEDELVKHKLPWVKLTGQTQKRDEVIDRFTSGQVPLFLISLKAGGVGLNLPQADTVIHYDPWWNPAAENQATDRAHRLGQTQSVWVIKLVAQGTIEERILGLQARKAELARELYSGSTARKQPLFTAEDVRSLLQPLG